MNDALKLIYRHIRYLTFYGSHNLSLIWKSLDYAIESLGVIIASVNRNHFFMRPGSNNLKICEKISLIRKTHNNFENGVSFRYCR